MNSDGPTFTVLMPVHRPPHFMPYALSSVLKQNRSDFELFIVCDGAPQATIDFANAAAQGDRRIKVFAFPKGERHGEAHRDIALAQAAGHLCCQIADDDLWFPHHLDEIERLLNDVEFGNLLHTYAKDEHQLSAFCYDLADPTVQRAMRETLWNFFGPTVVGYRLQTYRRLPVGWSPAPVGVWTDLAMWRRFLALPNVVVGSRIAVTSLHFPASARPDWSVERRQAEIAGHASFMGSREYHERISQQALLGVAHDMAAKNCVAEALSNERVKLEQALAACEANGTVTQDALRVLEADLERSTNTASSREREIETLRARVIIAEEACAREQEIKHKLSRRLADIERSLASRT
jgi:hypothetical protein